MADRWARMQNARLQKRQTFNYHIAHHGHRFYLCGCMRCPRYRDGHLWLKGKRLKAGRKSEYDIHYGRNKAQRLP